jgi:3-oxoacyl-[acyl-carrier-protein] synthase-3
VADAWIRGGVYKRIMLVGAETHSTGLDISTRGRDVSVIFGDGAAVALLEATDDPGRGVLAVELHADGRFAHDLWADAPGSIYSPRITKEMVDTEAIFPHMEGPKVFKHAIVKMPEVVMSVLGKAGLGVGDIKVFVPHQANLRISETVQKSLGLRDDQVFNNIQKYGNTTAASIPLALSEAIPARGVQRGDLVALAAFGAGFTWAAALARW